MSQGFKNNQGTHQWNTLIQMTGSWDGLERRWVCPPTPRQFPHDGFRHTVNSINNTASSLKLIPDSPMPEHPCLLSVPISLLLSILISCLTALEMGKKSTRHFPTLPLGLIPHSLCARHVRKGFQPFSQAVKDLNHRSLTLWICLIHHLTVIRFDCVAK